MGHEAIERATWDPACESSFIPGPLYAALLPTPDIRNTKTRPEAHQLRRSTYN